jgi:ribosomal protein S18 acetylase RimI-like enzyme
MTSALQLDFLDLRHFSAQHLQPLLDEESELWNRRLQWDYRNSASLVLQYIDSHMLSGSVALDQGRVCGYIFCVYESRKAVIGDVFASREGIGEAGAAAVEAMLIERITETLKQTPGLARIEAQLLLHEHGLLREPFERAGFKLYPRLFMGRDIAGSTAPTPQSSPAEIQGTDGARFAAEFRTWSSADYALAAPAIVAAYAGHIDSEINDQYLSVAGAQRFLHNVVRFPGCGTFEPRSSWVLAPKDNQMLFALLLCSRVGPNVGHVTQVCVPPEFQRQGIGTRLLELCASSLQADGCNSITLTVTEKNTAAVNLYKQLGYQVLHTFDAMLWRSHA